MSEVFQAIVSFVNDLWSIYGSKSVTPLAMYHRLVQKLKPEEKSRIQMAIDGFSIFFKSYEKYLITQEYTNIPRGTRIQYGPSESIYIDIQHYIHRADADTREAIRQHLLTIAILMSPSEEKVATLEKSARLDPVPTTGNAGMPPNDKEVVPNKKDQEDAMKELGIDTTTKEGEFVGGIMEKTRVAMENVNSDNPMQAMMALWQGGVINDMIAGMSQGVDSGSMDMGKLFGIMQTAMSSMAPPSGTAPKNENPSTPIVTKPPTVDTVTAPGNDVD